MIKRIILFLILTLTFQFGFSQLLTTGVGSQKRQPVVIGKLFENDFNSGNWTIEDGGLTSWTFNPSNIQVVGTAGAFTPLIRYNQWFSQSENLTFTAKYTVDANGVFLGVGLKTVSAFSSGSEFYTYMSTSITDPSFPKGSICIIKKSTLGTQVIVQNTVNVISYTNGDLIQVNFTSNQNVFTASYRNVTTLSAVETISYTVNDPFLYPLSVNSLPSIFQVAFQCARGNYTIEDWDFTINNFKNIDLLTIGDSKTEGYYVDVFGNRYSDLWGSNNPLKKVQTSASSGNTTQDILNNLPEIILQNPIKVILFIGRNDLANGIPSLTWQANYISITSQLEAAGIQVWHQLPTPETSLDQSALTAFIDATYTNVISVPPTFNAVTDNVADGIHPNISGNLKLYNNQALFFSL